MPPSAADVVAEARTWIGTRWRHQGRMKGVGVDCIGLIREVGVATGALVIDDPETARRQWGGYGRRPEAERMGAGLTGFLEAIDPADAVAGDVLWFSFYRQPAQHVGILAELNGRPTIVHAYALARAVVEHGLDDVWRARIAGAYRYPELWQPLS